MHVFLKRFPFWLFIFVLVGCDSADPEVQESGPISLLNNWETAAPAQVGMNGELLEDAFNAAQVRHRAKALLVVKDGKLVFERYLNGATRNDLFDVRSVTKTIISTLVGLAIEDGFLTLDTPIAPYLADFSETLQPGINDITIEHLLTMSGGWQWDEWTSTSYTDWITSGDHETWVVTLPHINPAGSRFTYNSGAVHLLGVIVEKSVGQSLESYASSKLFSHLGISSEEWEMLPSGYPNGGAGIDLHARDLAKIGQLFLQDGMSGNTQVLPPDWAQQATTPKHAFRNQWGPLNEMSYAYLWWTDEYAGSPVYFAWGYGGQFIFVAPHLNLVAVTTTDYRGVSSDPGGNSALERAMMAIIVNQIIPAVN